MSSNVRLGVPRRYAIAMVCSIVGCGGGASGPAETGGAETPAVPADAVVVDGSPPDLAGAEAWLSVDGALGSDAALGVDVPIGIDARIALEAPTGQLDGRADTGLRDAGADAALDAPLGGDGPRLDARTDMRLDARADVSSDVACTTDVACYTFAGGLPGTGVCRAGIASCRNGSLGPCTGQVGPSAEACNGLDDDCNGVIDDRPESLACGLGACHMTVPACTAGSPATCVAGTAAQEQCDGIDNDCDGAIDEDGCECVHVAPTGDDATGTGGPTAPLRTLAVAIERAASSGLARVCVAAGAACPANADYNEAITMRNGISLLGGYQAGAAWSRRDDCVTRIIGQNGRGLLFDATVTTPTVLDGFEVRSSADAINAAITVEGSTGAVITNNTIYGGGGTTSIGINITNDKVAATPLISRNAIVGGTGSATSIGIQSTRSAPIIQANCSSFDARGRCTGYGCFGSTRYIRSRPDGSSGGVSYGVRLASSPAAVLDGNAICGLGASTSAAGVWIAGNAAGTVLRGNNVTGINGAIDTIGVWADPCGGAAPWIVDNVLLAGAARAAGARGDGVRAVGDCHPTIEANDLVTGGEESTGNEQTGIYCTVDGGTRIASRCVVIDNLRIAGSSVGRPSSGVGVHCDEGACARIEGNRQITGAAGVEAYGVLLYETGTLVRKNVIEAGCGTAEAIGLASHGSFARVENNRIAGGTCAAPLLVSNSAAVRVRQQAGGNGIDLHSNLLDGLGQDGTCTSQAVLLTAYVPSPPTRALGMLRNNILLSGLCRTRYGLHEADAKADPELLAHNLFWHAAGSGTALYRDEAGASLLAIEEVNALADAVAAGNLAEDPRLTTGHIEAASACRNAGTATGAPSDDFEGDPRPQEGAFDIGPDEFLP